MPYVRLVPHEFILKVRWVFRGNELREIVRFCSGSGGMGVVQDSYNAIIRPSFVGLFLLHFYRRPSWLCHPNEPNASLNGREPLPGSSFCFLDNPTRVFLSFSSSS